ncbi:MAG: TMEM165/GDT1 family protein [Marmoricola sp.]
MIDLGVLAATFGLIFVSELPDKTAIASLVLGTKYPWRWVFAGVGAAFLAHVLIAVAAGSVLALLPQKPLETVVALLFLVGAVLIWREGLDDEDDLEAQEEAEFADAPEAGTFWKIATLGFGVIFVAEWGDLTQIMTANLAAKYHSPLSVGIGATLGLWGVGLLAILGGKSLLRVLPMKWITRVAAVIMVALCFYSFLKVGGLA